MLTCLIVTSEQESQREFGTMVRVLGFEAVFASSVKGAYDLMRTPLLAAIVVDEWWHTGEDPMDVVRQTRTRNRPPLVVVQKVRLAGLGCGADYAVHRDDPSHLGEVLAAIELKAHEQAARAEEALPIAAE